MTQPTCSTAQHPPYAVFEKDGHWEVECDCGALFGDDPDSDYMITTEEEALEVGEMHLMEEGDEHDQYAVIDHYTNEATND